MTDSFYALIHQRMPANASQTLLETSAGRVLSYAEAHETTGRYARCLAELGLKAGDRVASRVEKSPEALLLYLACLRGGFVYLPINPAYRASEVAYLLGNAEPGLLVSDPALATADGAIARAANVPHAFTLDAEGRGSFSERAAACDADAPIVARDRHDGAAMLYTSGTTGQPKGAMLSHGNLASNALAVSEAWRFTARDVLLHALPIFHVHGLFVACHCVLLAGARMLWQPKLELDALVAHLPEATVLMGVPTFYTRLLDRPDFDREAARSIRLFVSGSAPLLAETHRAFRARTGQAILERYGMTETGMIAGSPYEGERVPGRVGRPFAGVDVRVAGADGVALGPGCVGEVQVRGAGVMTGYWRAAEKTREATTADGYFRTGDLGELDAGGSLAIVGRAKDLIISGGLNVYPKEVESAIDALPGVIESAVVGVPHPDFGEVGVAIIQAASGIGPDDEAPMLAALKEQIAHFKLPKRLFFTNELPRNAMGKLQKQVLRERYVNLFGA